METRESLILPVSQASRISNSIWNTYFISTDKCSSHSSSNKLLFTVEKGDNYRKPPLLKMQRSTGKEALSST